MITEDELVKFKSFVQAMTFDVPSTHPEIYIGTDVFGRNIRLDFQYPQPIDPRWAYVEYDMTEDQRLTVIEHMFEEIQADLDDLIENGDMSSSDVILKYFDGEKKLGKSCSSFIINSGRLISELKPSKDLWQYTVYLNISLEFE